MRSNIVKLNNINSTSDLIYQIERLNAIKDEQEEMMKEQLKALGHSLQPGVLIKKALHNLNEDGELKQSALKTSLNLGTQFLLDKVIFGRGFGLKSYFLNMALKKVASFIIAKNTTSQQGK